MKTYKKRSKLSVLLFVLIVPVITFGQEGLLGSWKYVSSAGEMTMQINASTIVINGQSFPYKVSSNVLLINEGITTTPYPYTLDGKKIALKFPGGQEVVFTRITADGQPQGQLPQNMPGPKGNAGQKWQGSTLSGLWSFQSQQGQMVLEFISANELSLNGAKTQYQLKEGIIMAMGDYGWIDYPYTLSQGTLTITFPDGTRIPFIRPSSAAVNQQGMNLNQQTAGGSSTWQLKGALCSWSGSSNSISSYSRTQKIVFDGQGNFQYGSESSFSSNAGIAYAGNPNIKTGTYRVNEKTITLYFQGGDTYEVKINMRQDNGMITELIYSGTLYAKGLCDQ